MKKHILVIEDDSNIRLGIKDALESEGYEVSEAGHGREVLALVRQRRPDLAILDIMLPGKSGFDLCRDIRAEGFTLPILMLTAKGQEIDKVLGLELGADDYITKPFGIRELLARVHAHLRRTQPAAATLAAAPETLDLAGCHIDVRAMRGQRHGQPVEFTAREMKVLLLLHSEQGRVVDRNRILDGVWGLDYPGTTRTLDQVIVKLRQKIEADAANPVVLTTVHGVGYRLENRG